MSSRKLWTVKEVAEFFSVDESWVYRHIPALPLPGRLKRFDPDTIMNLRFVPSSLKTEEKAKTRGHKSKKKEDLWS